MVQSTKFLEGLVDVLVNRLLIGLHARWANCVVDFYSVSLWSGGDKFENSHFFLLFALLCMPHMFGNLIIQMDKMFTS